MASEVDICNLALSHLGDGATVASINPPEGSAQAEHCARFYPLARDTLLTEHAWSFATRRVALSLLADGSTPSWAYAYAVPNKALTIWAVLEPDAMDDAATQPFAREVRADGTPMILTGQADAVARYAFQVTDTGSFSPAFVSCLSWLLASYLAGPVIKGDSGANAGTKAYQVYLNRLAAAREHDANQGHKVPAHNVPWLAVR